MGGCASAQRDPADELRSAAPAPVPAREEFGEENNGRKKSLQFLFNEMDAKQKAEEKEEALKTKEVKEVQAELLQEEQPKDEAAEENATELKKQDQ